ncbi:cytochrome P450 [Tricholoma matsutake]|nr:cytochrome P450 [Tricholoma matsutake 945]
MRFTVVQAAVAGLTIWVFKSCLQKALVIKSKQHALKVCPGGSLLWLHPFRSLSIIFGPLFPFKGQMGYYFAQFSLYKRYGSTCLSSILVWNALPIFWLSDAKAIKAVSADRVLFSKDVEAYEPLNIYGPNIVGAEGSEWKRHRSAANSAFNDENNALVWRESARILYEWFDEIDNPEGPPQIGDSIDLLQAFTHIALLIISSAGFGHRVSLKEDSKAEPPLGHKLAFKPAITTALRLLLLKALTPSWLYDLSGYIHLPYVTPILNKTSTSFEAVRDHMLEVISLARAWISDGKITSMDAGLLRNLVEANISHDVVLDKGQLSDEELLSDTFAYLIAGHETTANTLSFALALLALYPDVQQRLYEESCRLWPDGAPSPESPSFHKKSLSSLGYTTAAFYEALRLFPPVVRLGKQVLTDTDLKAHRFTTSHDGKVRDVEEYTVTIPGGSMVIIDISALHMNPIYWGDDAAEFKPERFIDTETYRWPRDAFDAFSAGPRNCIGQRFAITEGVCILAHLTRRYEILVPDDLQMKPYGEQKQILLKWTPDFTAKPANARVRLRRRL